VCLLLRNIGATELLLILVLLLLIFGGSRLPQLARGLGDGLRELKRALSGQTDDDRKG
jgi:sec-independent protein translocase protein TatA